VGSLAGWEIDMHADYAFQIKGRLTPALKTALEPLEATDVPADTVLVGRVADRAAVHGFIARIEALGLELVELRRQLPDSSGAHGCPACGCGRAADGPGTVRTASRSRS
jgi:hypothetical protein